MNVNIFINGEDHHDHRHRGRIIFAFGQMREHSGTVTKTPEFRRRIRKEIDVSTEMTVTQECVVTVKSIKDSKGNPARIDGMPEWLTDNTDAVALVPAADGMSCVVRAVGMIGVANVQANVDADLGTGVTLVIGTAEFNVVAGMASVVELEAGTPTEIP